MTDANPAATAIDYTAPRLTPDALQALTLKPGKHAARSEGLCVMEAVAWRAGERHTDHPACACPVIAAYARRTNDSLDQEVRDALKERTLKFVGTRSTPEVERRRRDEIAFRGITLMLPFLLELVAGIGDKRFPDKETDKGPRTWNTQIRQHATALRALTREQGRVEWRAAAQRARATLREATTDAYADADADAYADAYAYAYAYADALKAKRDEIRAKVREHALGTLDAMFEIGA